MVPPTECERHTAGTRFDEPARHQKMLHEFWTAIVAILRIALSIALAHFLVLLFDVERFKQFAGSQDAESLLIESVKPFHHSACINIAPELIEAGEESLAIGEPVKRHAI